ncbi:MAG: hypothetical protein V5A47_08620 [Bacteroidales bacterium]|nr:hypothetical protein [Bacteroidales bacterium]MBS3775513.1 hypothetical protein [Bacteroidales bacterium]
MKRFYIIIILTILTLGSLNSVQAQTGEELVNMCTELAEDAKYLKDYTVKLSGAAPGEDPPSQKKSLMLRKNTQYRFTICSSQDFPGRGILKVYSSNKLLASNYVENTGKMFPSVDIKVQKTGPYHLWVEFEDGKEGLAVVVLSFVKKL